MKTTKYFSAVIALLSALSCQKEGQPVITNSEIEGSELITCTFAANDNTAKTTILDDGKTPVWKYGDKIMLYDGASETREISLNSYFPSEYQGCIDETDLTKFTFVKPQGWTNVYAIYPSCACVSLFKANDPKITFSAQDGTFGKANICVAVGIAGKMSFKNVGAILKFPSKPAAVTKILIPTVSGSYCYKVAFSGAEPYLTRTFWKNTNSYNIGSGSGPIYIGVPASKNEKYCAFTYSGESGILGSYVTLNANNIVTNHIYTLPAIEANGKLPGVFSVSNGADDLEGTEDDIRVQFSKGNLYYDNPSGGTPSFQFETNQYDSQPTSDSAYVSTHISHFLWATKSTSLSEDIAYATGVEISSERPADVFFTNDEETTPRTDFEAAGSTNTWRTLSSTELQFLMFNSFGGRRSVNRYAKARVNGIPGLILFPDNYTGTSAGSGISSKNNENASFPEPSLPSEIWSSIELSGCVFLPAAGYRQETNVSCINSYGYYWTSNSGASHAARYIFFCDTSIGNCACFGNHDGRSVRLVTTIQ